MTGGTIMQIIKTAAGVEHSVDWCGVSTLDGVLYFDFNDERSAAEIVFEFSNADNTAEITYTDGVSTLVYIGFTKLVMFSRRQGQCVRIGLAKGGVS